MAPHLDHARAFADAAETALGGRSPGTVADLGSGAGLPALVLATRWTSARVLLVEVRGRRVAFLSRAVRELGLADRVTIAAERAEVVGRTPARRESFELVTARGFGRPAVVAECAAPLLGAGGLLVVSEPPPGSPPERDRWPAEGLAQLGLSPAREVGSRYRFVVLARQAPCPSRFPRRVGMPAKRPLF